MRKSEGVFRVSKFLFVRFFAYKDLMNSVGLFFCSDNFDEGWDRFRFLLFWHPHHYQYSMDFFCILLIICETNPSL